MNNNLYGWNDYEFGPNGIKIIKRTRYIWKSKSLFL